MIQIKDDPTFLRVLARMFKERLFIAASSTRPELEISQRLKQIADDI
jgi:ActR/RegA family two-component response regulator